MRDRERKPLIEELGLHADLVLLAIAPARRCTTSGIRRGGVARVAVINRNIADRFVEYAAGVGVVAALECALVVVAVVIDRPVVDTDTRRTAGENQPVFEKSRLSVSVNLVSLL